MSYNNNNYNNYGKGNNNYKNYNGNNYNGHKTNSNEKNKNYSGKSGINSGNNVEKYSGAPYNFISLSNTVIENYESMDKLPPHNEIIRDRFSGEIEYTVNALSPIFISNGNKQTETDFFTNANGNYAIPGSSIRGLLRSNVQILGLGSVANDIDDNTMMYRTVGAAKSLLKDRYNEILGVKTITLGNGVSVSITKNVKSGYIAKEGNKYFLYGTCVKKINDTYGAMNYYTFRNDPEHPVAGLQDILRFEQDIRKPFIMKVNYEIKGEKRVVSVHKYNEKSTADVGYMVRSGFMNKKKALYIVPEIDMTEKIEIPENDIIAYKHDYETKVNQLGKNKSYYELPGNNENKPVFYIEYGGKIYFGFTPYLRLFYDKSIYDAIPDNHKNNEILDFPKSMFGYANDKSSYKSRIYFDDAVLSGDNAVQDSKTYVLGSPKPSSYMDYLKQGKDTVVNTYNSDGLRIRGIKQYWLRKNIVSCPMEIKNDKAATTLRPIKDGAVFKGKVRFKNLSDIELGLLLWSIRLEPGCHNNIGMGKAYGYGKIDICINNLNIFDYNQMYCLDEFCMNPYTNKTNDVDKLINVYKKYLSDNMSKDADSIPGIRDFISMKSYTPEDKYIKYMELKDYQNRKISLQSVNDIVKLCKEKDEQRSTGNDKINKSNTNNVNNKRKEEAALDGPVTDDMLKQLSQQFGGKSNNKKRK